MPRRPRKEIASRVGELLRLVELDDYAARNVQDLSGGQQQRVALARSLAVRPEVLLLDEPFSALDAVTRRALQRDVRRIAIEIGITLVIVTHDIAEAVVMADRAIVMKSDPGRDRRNSADRRSTGKTAIAAAPKCWRRRRPCRWLLSAPPAARSNRRRRTGHDTLKIVAGNR